MHDQVRTSSMLQVGVYLPMYDYLHGRLHSLAAYGPVVAGAVSRTAAVLVMSPLERMRVRVQVTLQLSQ